MAGMFACLSMNERAFSSLESHGLLLSSNWKQFLSAGLVGVEVSLFLSPFELIRIQGQNKGKGGIIAASKYVMGLNHDRSTRGLVSILSRGMSATMLRETKYSAGQFFLVGWIERQIQSWRPPVPTVVLADKASSVRSSFSSASEAYSSPWTAIGTKIVSAMLGGFACTIVSHPDDVIKTRMQTHLSDSPKYASYSSYMATGREIVRNEGFAALYKGALFRCCLRVPLGLSVVLLTSTWSRPEIQRILE